MTRVVLVAGVLFFVGATLVLGELRWFRRRPLLQRLAPYVPGSHTRAPGRAGGVGAAAGVGAALAAGGFPAAVGRVGDVLARTAGVAEPLAVRLERVHAPLTPTEFRVRQLGWVAAGFAVGALLAAAWGLPGPLALGFVLGGPLLGFLLVEQRLARASGDRQRRLFLELPVVAEQLGMLLGAGYSLGAAVSRLADRGRGVCSQDLARVVGRIRLGVGDVEALREWAAVAQVPALDRLVGVLALHREAGGLGELIGQEARSVRREVHRELLETMERRAQQVWVPVTLATLVPGVIFLAIPFVDVLRQFSAG